MKLNSLFIVAAAAGLTACAGGQDTGTAGASAGLSVPTCGSWVVFVERPAVSSGGYQADAMQRSIVQSLSSGGCQAVTSKPAAVPSGASLLTVASMVSSTGTEGRISTLATNSDSGAIMWRLQQTIKAGEDGTAAASAIGSQLAGNL